MPAVVDLTGLKFGRLQVISRSYDRPGHGTRWICRCECGSPERIVFGASLSYGHTVSCGCYHKYRLRAMLTTHGDSKRSGWTPEYRAWVGLRTRCLDTNHSWYPSYGGRGIQVCAAWRDSYEVFLADMGRRPSADHSLDRIDNNGNYEPSNCRWATRSEQQRNKRRYAKSPQRVRMLQRAGLM